jgi:hypothetical protein
MLQEVSMSETGRSDVRSWDSVEEPYPARTKQRGYREESRYGFGGEKTYVEQVRRNYRKGAEIVKQQVEDIPILPVLTAAAIGFAAGWFSRGSLNGSRSTAWRRSAPRRRNIGERSSKPLIESDRVEGTAVYDLDGQQIGTIRRLMIEKVGGRVIYALMEFGGFIGIGTDEYAIPWRKLEYDTALEGYKTDITAEQLKNAPAFSRDRNYDWSDEQSERDLHDYYRVTYYWIAPDWIG